MATSQQNPVYASLAPLGFETVGAVCCGIWKDYAVSLRIYQGYWVDFAVRAERSDSRLLRALTKSFKEISGKRTSVSFSPGKNRGVSFNFRPNRKSSYEEQFSAFADACVRALQENGLTPAKTCAVCGAALPESLCLVGTYQPVHSACMRSSLEKTKAEAEDNQANGSYLTGLVGALLGMLVGLIPNVFVLAASERISAWLFALVPLAAMWCYRKFNGKLSKGSIGIIIAVSLLGVVVMQYANLAIYVMQEYHVALGTALSFTAELFADGETFGQIMGNSVMLFVFMAIGILVAWRYLNQTNSGNIANMEAALSTLRPNPDFSQENVYDDF